MSCSLFDVVDGKGKAASGSLAGLVHKLERDRMVRKRESECNVSRSQRYGRERNGSDL